MKNLLERKLEFHQCSFYKNGIKNEKDRKEQEELHKLEIEIKRFWLKYPNWGEIIKIGKPRIPLNAASIPLDKSKLPKKGSKVLFITCDKVKNKSSFFGFETTNYRVEEGIFDGIKISKRRETGDSLFVKVIVGNYIYSMFPHDVIPA